MLDTFHRYSKIYDLVQREASNTKDRVVRLLDVGSNGPGFGHYNHFANVEQTNIDIVETSRAIQEKFPRIKFVKYEGNALPFEDGSFDIVICVDVLEHIPPEQRKKFVSEVVRVSRRHTVFVFPVRSSQPWEKLLSAITLKKISFLQEHIEFGLPREEEFYKAVRVIENVKIVQESGNMSIWFWIPVKFISSFLNIFLKNRDSAIGRLFLMYKSTVFKVLNWGQCYSKVFFLEKN